MIPRLAPPLFLAFFVGPAFAQTLLEPIASEIRMQPINLPASNSVVSLTPADKENPRTTYTIQRSFAADGTFTATWNSPRYQSYQNFRPDGTLISSRQTDLLKGVTVEAKTTGGRQSVETVISVNGTVKSDKKTDLKPAIALRDELQNLIVQSWEYGVRDGLRFGSLSPDGGMVGEFLIQFWQGADPTTLSKKYKFPEEFRSFLARRNAYVVADMSLQGVASLFYPHHFYLVYGESPRGLELTAYFGEDPANPVYQMISTP